MKLRSCLLCMASLMLLVNLAGCSLFPEARQRDRIHNPFPQLKRVAVLPFFNQSSEPTLDTSVVTEAYYAALQSVPGFEVLPVGVTRTLYNQRLLQYGEPTCGQDFQRLAQALDVEAVVVGSVTDFDPFYPPRMAMTVHWYAANEGFHPIPEGYGLPWGTDQEKHIPQRIARAAEFELARSQLATQTPQVVSPSVQPTADPTLENLPPLPSAAPAPSAGHAPAPSAGHAPAPSAGQRRSPEATLDNPFEPYQRPDSLPETDSEVEGNPFSSAEMSVPTHVRSVNYEKRRANHESFAVNQRYSGEAVPVSHADETWSEGVGQAMTVPGTATLAEGWELSAPLPPQWPDPTDLIPDPPVPHRPLAMPNHEPVLSHTRLYRGDDPYFTNRLADHVETGDDARPGGWQGYLKRSDDFIRFCCHLHVTEMLESRGGSDQSDLILQWPLSRY